MMNRFDNKKLKLRQIYKNGKFQFRDHKYDVIDLATINNTFFPDVDSITIGRDPKGARPAEIKFVTSSFNYHKSSKEQFKSFIESNGCIIVVKHDELPRDLLEECPSIDIFALYEFDFISFANENFERYINRQIKSRSFKKIWVMAQSPNFNKGAEGISSARDSGIWCPTENLGCFDLTVGDTVIFVKTLGASKQKVSGTWKSEHGVPEKWRLEELYISRVIYPIQSRGEYCITRGRPVLSPLWYDETETGRNDKRVTQRKGTGIRWNRVFQFHEVETLDSLGITFEYLSSKFPLFVQAVIEAYTNPVSRELTIDLYTNLLEFLAGIENQAYLELKKIVPQEDMPVLPWTIDNLPHHGTDDHPS